MELGVSRGLVWTEENTRDGSLRVMQTSIAAMQEGHEPFNLLTVLPKNRP